MPGNHAPVSEWNLSKIDHFLIGSPSNVVLHGQAPPGAARPSRNCLGCVLNSSHEKQDDEDDHDNPDGADATVTVPVPIATEAATESSEQEDDEDDDEDESDGHGRAPYVLAM
jgi:hypothetical protein